MDYTHQCVYRRNSNTEIDRWLNSLIGQDVRTPWRCKARDWFGYMASSLLVLELAKQQAKPNLAMLFHCVRSLSTTRGKISLSFSLVKSCAVILQREERKFVKFSCYLTKLLTVSKPTLSVSMQENKITAGYESLSFDDLVLERCTDKVNQQLGCADENQNDFMLDIFFWYWMERVKSSGTVAIDAPICLRFRFFSSNAGGRARMRSTLFAYIPNTRLPSMTTNFIDSCNS